MPHTGSHRTFALGESTSLGLSRMCPMVHGQPLSTAHLEATMSPPLQGLSTPRQKSENKQVNRSLSPGRTQSLLPSDNRTLPPTLAVTRPDGRDLVSDHPTSSSGLTTGGQLDPRTNHTGGWLLVPASAELPCTPTRPRPPLRRAALPLPGLPGPVCRTRDGPTPSPQHALPLPTPGLLHISGPILTSALPQGLCIAGLGLDIGAA